MKKTAIVVFLSLLIMTLGIISCAESQTIEENPFVNLFEGYHKESSDKSVFIIRMKEGLEDVPTDVTVPDFIGFFKVNGLESEAFRSYEINSVYVPKGIVEISKHLLTGSHVKEITVPSEIANLFDHYDVKVNTY